MSPFPVWRTELADILLVEDKRGMRVMLTQALSEEGWGVTAVSTGEEALKRLGEKRFAAVLTDVCLPGRVSGLDVLRSIPVSVPSIVMTAFGTIDMAVKAMKAGAMDFVTKPFDLDTLLEKLSRAFEGGGSTIVGDSSCLKESLARADRASSSDMNILISGESGTGKELLAMRIHRMSRSSMGPFVPVNCAAIPGNLMESELFGAEKGAYTGSSETRPGLFALAGGGTIFLDEIGDLDLLLQGKLLRVLESGTFHSVGGKAVKRSDARVISASNRELKTLMDKGEFRRDLYYRIAEFPVTLPPLRERGNDLRILARHFAGLYRGELTEEALSCLEHHHWPGNVRELKNHIRRACVNSENGVITPGLLEIPECSGDTGPCGTLLEESARAAREREKELIHRALNSTGGNRRKAAEILGVSYRTLLNRLKEMDIADEQ